MRFFFLFRRCRMLPCAGARTVFSISIFYRGVYRVVLPLLPLLLGVMGAPAHAGRPMVVDDAAVLDARACQVEAWVERGQGASTAWLMPSCNSGLAMVGATELAVGGARTMADGNEGAAESTSLSWQIKHLLRAAEVGQPGLALSVGGDGVGGAQAGQFINGIVSLPLGEAGAQAHVNLGATRQRDRGVVRTAGSYGAALETPVNRATQASVEGFGVRGQRPRWQLGLRHALMERVQIDASVGSRLGDWGGRGERLVTVGLVVLAPGWLR